MKTMKGWVTHGRPFETLLDCAALMYGGIPLEKLQAKDSWRQRETPVRMGRLNQKSIWRKQVK